jgi:hypothetical protein
LVELDGGDRSSEDARGDLVDPKDTECVKSHRRREEECGERPIEPSVVEPS